MRHRDLLSWCVVLVLSRGSVGELLALRTGTHVSATASAIVPSIDARCAAAIRSTVARRFSFRNSDRLRAWGPLCSMAVQKMIEAGLPGFRVAARTRNPDACLAVGQASALGSSARAPPRSQRKLPSPRGLAGRDRKRVLMVGSQSFNPRACWRRSLLQARRPGAT